MANSSIAITPGVGANVDTYTQVGGDHRQAFVVGDSGDTTVVGMRADGYFNIRPDPTTLLFDTFETLDTTNTWTLSGTVVPTGAPGVLNVAAGTPASNTSVARSQPAFTPGSSAYLQAAILVTLDAAVVTGNTRWWGLGVPQVTPTTGVPLTNGVVFECRAADGLLYGSVYSGTALTQSVLLTRPTDGLVHRYQITYKASRVYFNLDNVEVGSLAFPNPQISALPLTIGSVNGASVLGANATLTSTLMGVADTGKNASAIADGIYPWREARVSASGGLNIKGTTLPTFTGAIAAAATGTLGSWDVSEANNGTFFVKNTVAASPWAGTPVLVFEQSDDNVQWGPMLVVRGDTGTALSTHTLPANAANTELTFNAMFMGANWVRIRVTTGPTTNGLTVVLDPGTMPFVPVVAISGILTDDVTDRAARLLGVTTPTPSSQYLTGTAAAGTALTVTLPAAGAGIFQYITSIELTLYSATARTGSATPILVTSTNLNGAVVWTMPTVGALGAVDRFQWTPTTPLKASTANTTVTFVAPIVTGGLWRINVSYFTGA